MYWDFCVKLVWVSFWVIIVQICKYFILHTISGIFINDYINPSWDVPAKKINTWRMKTNFIFSITVTVNVENLFLIVFGLVEETLLYSYTNTWFNTPLSKFPHDLGFFEIELNLINFFCMVRTSATRTLKIRILAIKVDKGGSREIILKRQAGWQSFAGGQLTP